MNSRDLLIEEAIDAFWSVVVKHYPEAKTGDLSPETTIGLVNAAERAVEEWVEYNVPKEPLS